MDQVLPALASECSSYEPWSQAKYMSLEILKLLFLTAQAFHHISHQKILTTSRSQSKGYLQWKTKHNLTLIVKYFSAVPASWSSMRQNSSIVFPLITHARISGAINWFWELSSIFNPSSGSVGPQWVKTSLQNQNKATIQHIQGSNKGLEYLLILDEVKSTKKTFQSFPPDGWDTCQ